MLRPSDAGDVDAGALELACPKLARLLGIESPTREDVQRATVVVAERARDEPHKLAHEPAWKTQALSSTDASRQGARPKRDASTLAAVVRTTGNSAPIAWWLGKSPTKSSTRSVRESSTACGKGRRKQTKLSHRARRAPHRVPDGSYRSAGTDVSLPESLDGPGRGVTLSTSSRGRSSKRSVGMARYPNARCSVCRTRL